jgi:acetyltransferase-like isoleucine patch superfamily enzyme
MRRNVCSRPTKIKKQLDTRNVWVGSGAILMPGIQIGDNSTIGAVAVVTESVPPNVFAAGNPRRMIRELK